MNLQVSAVRRTVQVDCKSAPLPTVSHLYQQKGMQSSFHLVPETRVLYTVQTRGDAVFPSTSYQQEGDIHLYQQGDTQRSFHLCTNNRSSVHWYQQQGCKGTSLPTLVRHGKSCSGKTDLFIFEGDKAVGSAVPPLPRAPAVLVGKIHIHDLGFPQKFYAD